MSQERVVTVTITGAQGSGKTTIANLLEDALFDAGYSFATADGEQYRRGNQGTNKQPHVAIATVQTEVITPHPIRHATEEELEAQRRSFVLAEAAFGNDADEAAFRSALARGDKAEIARLDAQAEKRRNRAEKILNDEDRP